MKRQVIDERVVSMQFDSDQFIKNVQSTILALDKLQSIMDRFGGESVTESLSEVADTADSISGAFDGVDTDALSEAFADVAEAAKSLTETLSGLNDAVSLDDAKTQVEELNDAVNSIDTSSAEASLGNVAEATDNLAESMGGVNAEPVAEALTDVAASAEGVTEALSEVSTEPVVEALDNVVESADNLSDINTESVVEAFDAVSTSAETMTENVQNADWDGALDAIEEVSEAADRILDPEQAAEIVDKYTTALADELGVSVDKIEVSVTQSAEKQKTFWAKWLDFSRAATGKSAEEVDKEQKKMVKGAESAAEKIADVFSLKGQIVQDLYKRIAKTVGDAIEGAWKTLTSYSQFSMEHIQSGWSEYQAKMDKELTLKNALKVGQKGSNYTMHDIDNQLEELNTFADKTIFSYSDMVANLPKLINQNIPLKDATKAIEGITAWAALAGGDAQSASSAMYNIAQSFGVGHMQAQDWNSIVNQSMDTAEVKEAFIQMAVKSGELYEKQGKYYTKKNNKEVNAGNFKETLQYGWLTNSVMMDVFKMLSDTNTELGAKAMNAATQVTSLKKMTESLKESIGSGWGKSFELIFGNLDEQTVLWSKLNEIISSVLEAQSKFRNDALKMWRSLTINVNNSGINELQSILENIATLWSEFQGAFGGGIEDAILNNFGGLGWFKELYKDYDEGSAASTLSSSYTLVQREMTAAEALGAVLANLTHNMLAFTQSVLDWWKSPAMGKEGQTRIDVLSELIGNLVSILISAGEIAGGIVGAGFEMLLGLLTDLEPLWLAIADGVRWVADRLRDFAKTLDGPYALISGLVVLAIKYLPLIITSVKTLFAGFASGLAGGGLTKILLNGGLTAAFFGLYYALKNIPQIQEWFKNLWTTISGFLGGKLGDLQTWAQGIGASFLEWASSMQPVGEEIVRVLGDIGGELWRFISDIWTLISDVFATDLLPFFSDIFSGLGDVFDGLFKSLFGESDTDAAEEMGDSLMTVADAVGVLDKKSKKNRFAGFLQTLRQVFKDVGNLVRTAIEFLAPFVPGVLEVLSGALTFLVDVALPTVGDFVTGAIGFFTDFVIPGAWNFAGGVLGAAMNWLMNTALPWLTNAGLAFARFINGDDWNWGDKWVWDNPDSKLGKIVAFLNATVVPLLFDETDGFFPKLQRWLLGDDFTWGQAWDWDTEGSGFLGTLVKGFRDAYVVVRDFFTNLWEMATGTGKHTKLTEKELSAWNIIAQSLEGKEYKGKTITGLAEADVKTMYDLEQALAKYGLTLENVQQVAATGGGGSGFSILNHRGAAEWSTNYTVDQDRTLGRTIQDAEELANAGIGAIGGVSSAANEFGAALDTLTSATEKEGPGFVTWITEQIENLKAFGTELAESFTSAISPITTAIDNWWKEITGKDLGTWFSDSIASLQKSIREFKIEDFVASLKAAFTDENGNSVFSNISQYLFGSDGKEGALSELSQALFGEGGLEGAASEFWENAQGLLTTGGGIVAGGATLLGGAAFMDGAGKITDAVSNFGNLADTVSKFDFSSLTEKGGLLDQKDGALGTVLSAFDNGKFNINTTTTVKKVDTIGTTVLKIAASVAVIVYAIKMLTDIMAEDGGQERIQAAMLNLVEIMGALLAVGVVFTAVDRSVGSKDSKSTNVMSGPAAAILSMAASIMLMVMAMERLQALNEKMDGTDYWAVLGEFIALIAGFAAGFALVSKVSDGKGGTIEKDGEETKKGLEAMSGVWTTVLATAAGLYIMTLALEKVADMNANNGFANIQAGVLELLELMAIIAAGIAGMEIAGGFASKLAGGKDVTTGTITTMITTIASIMGIVSSLETLLRLSRTYSEEEITAAWKTLEGIVVALFLSDAAEQGAGVIFQSIRTKLSTDEAKASASQWSDLADSLGFVVELVGVVEALNRMAAITKKYDTHTIQESFTWIEKIVGMLVGRDVMMNIVNAATEVGESWLLNKNGATNDDKKKDAKASLAVIEGLTDSLGFVIELIGVVEALKMVADLYKNTDTETMQASIDTITTIIGLINIHDLIGALDDLGNGQITKANGVTVAFTEVWDTIDFLAKFFTIFTQMKDLANDIQKNGETSYQQAMSVITELMTSLNWSTAISSISTAITAFSTENSTSSTTVKAVITELTTTGSFLGAITLLLNAMKSVASDESVDADKLKATADAISAGMPGLAAMFGAVAVIANNPTMQDPVAVLKYIGIMGEILAGSAAIVGLIGGVGKLIDSLAGEGAVVDAIKTGGEMLQATGEALGKFLGGIIGGLVQGTMDAVDLVAEGEEMATAMGLLGEGLAGFGDKLKDVNLDQLSQAVGITIQLVDAEATLSKIPKFMGGMVTSISEAGGRTHIAKFAEDFPVIGTQLVEMAKSLAPLSDTSGFVDVERASKIVKVLADASSAVSIITKNADSWKGLFGLETVTYTPIHVLYNDLQEFSTGIIEISETLQPLTILDDAGKSGFDYINSAIDFLRNVAGLIGEMPDYINEVLKISQGSELYEQVKAYNNGKTPEGGLLGFAIRSIFDTLGTLSRSKTDWDALLNGERSNLPTLGQALSEFYLSIDFTTVDVNIETGCAGIIDKVRSYYNNMSSAGAYLMQGLAAGINANAYRAVNAARDAAGAVNFITRTTFQEKSPSHVFYQIGDYLMQGLANGIGDNSSDPISTASTVAAMTIEAFEASLEEDEEFILKPVVDMTNVTDAGRQTRGLFGQQSFSVGANTSYTMARNTMTDAAVTAQNANSAAMLTQMGAIEQRLTELGTAVTNMRIVLDTGVLVGQTAPAMERQLGIRTALRTRRV